MPQPSEICKLLDSDALGEVTGLVYIAAPAHRDVVREELKRHHFEDGEQEFVREGDVDDVLYEAGYVRVSFNGDGNDAAGAGGDFLNVAEGFFVLQDGGRVVGVFGGDADYGERFVDEGVGAVLHFAGGVALGVDVGDFLQLERAFEGDGVMDAAAEEKEIVRRAEDLGELLAL